MGQKYSCFKEFDCLQVIGRRRKRPKSSEFPPLDSSVYFTKCDIPDWTSIPISEGFGSYFHLNSENVIHATGHPKRTDAKDIDVPCTPTPDFEIKDGTIILTPSKTDLSLPSNFLSSSSALFGVESIVPSQDLKETSERVKEDNYHHLLPYIPPKPTLAIFDDFNNKTQQSDNSMGTFSPVIPPRENEMILMNSQGNVDNSQPNEDDSHFIEDIPTSDQKVPPEIPPRLHERI